jgi:hypothetical protein
LRLQSIRKKRALLTAQGRSKTCKADEKERCNEKGDRFTPWPQELMLR